MVGFLTTPLAYVSMAVVMVFINMAYIVMARIVMACIVMAYVGMAPAQVVGLLTTPLQMHEESSPWHAWHRSHPSVPFT